MIYEIIRETEAPTLVALRFTGDVPVEVREALLGAGFRWIYYTGFWTALDRDDEGIRVMISEAEKNVRERPAMSKAKEAELKAEYMARISVDENERWQKYYEKEIGTLVRLTDGRILNIEKPRIETSFCFGESGYDADDAAHMAWVAKNREGYFRRENLKGLKEMIDILSRSVREGYYGDEKVWVSDKYRNKPGIAQLNIGDVWGRRGDSEIVEVSEEDRERILEGYRKAYAAFEKRINAYLKRYGLSKVHSWTYWRDA